MRQHDLSWGKVTPTILRKMIGEPRPRRSQRVMQREGQMTHDTSGIPAARTFSNTHSGRQRSSLSARQLEWQTIVAT